jgi:hypothetical protein
MLCVVISINMCCNPKLFYVPYFKFLCNYFLKFVAHKINFEMVKSGMVVLTEKEKTDVTDADVSVELDIISYCWSAGGREGQRKLT